EQSALDIEVCLVGSRSLADQTKSKPIHRCDTQLRPTVKETSRRVARVEDIFTLAVEFQLPPAHRALVTWSDASRISKYATQHRRQVPFQFFAATKVVAD